MLAPSFIVAAATLAPASGEPIALLYHAPPECPAASAFIEQVQARTDHVHFTNDGEGERTFTVRLETTNLGAQGALEILGRDGSLTTRQVTSESCALVLEALALVAALSIDPHALLTPIAVAPHVEPSVEPARPPEPATSLEPPPAPIAPPPIEATFWQLSLGAAAGAAQRVSYGPGMAASGFVEARRVAPGGSFAARLGFDYTSRLGILTDVGRANLRWYDGRLEGCAVFKAYAFSMLPCVGATAGVLVARGRDIVDAKRVSRPWLAPSVAAHLGYPFGSRFTLELGLGVDFPLFHDELRFLPTTTITAVAAAAPWGTMGVNVHFP